MANPDLDALVARWHAHVSNPDPRALWDWLHPDAVFESPVVHTPQRGRDIVFKYLSSAEQVLGGEGFTYVGEWRSANGVILEFTNVVEGLTVNGIDMITFDPEGSIIHFKVMVRPLKAINLMHRMMGEQLQKLASA
ncbi:MAG: nuclear transport factor 2 family protein [Sphingomonadaceae bacterium]